MEPPFRWLESHPRLNESSDGRLDDSNETWDSLHRAVNQRRMRKPAFVTDVVWNAIRAGHHSMHYLEEILAARHHRRERVVNGGIKNLAEDWLVSTLSIKRAASDPRDYIYGPLGVTDIPITPDYTPAPKIADLYVRYSAGCLDAMLSISLGDRDSLRKPLRFLSDATAGRRGGPDQLLTWVADFPASSFVRAQFEGDAGRDIFSGDDGDGTRRPWIDIQAQSLHV